MKSVEQITKELNNIWSADKTVEEVEEQLKDPRFYTSYKLQKEYFKKYD